MLDNSLDRVAKEATAERVLAKKKPRPKPEAPKRVLPKLAINKPRLPKIAEGRDVNNVVNVPESLLHKVTRSVDKRTAEVNDLLLSSLIPLLLSYETGTNYARTALRDGLNLEIDFDEGLGEAVKQIGYLNVLFFYVKRSKLPVSVKRRFMNVFSAKLAEHALTSLIETNKAHDRKTLAQDLQAVVYSRQQKRATVRTVGDKSTTQAQPKATPVASKSRRRA